MPDSEAKKAWMRANTKTYGIKLNKNTDAELMQKLDSEKHYATYIKQLIRADLEKSKTH